MTRRIAALLLALLVLAGCARLPVSGPVVAADPTINNRPSLGLYAQGPQEGAEPTQIVEGFLAASATGFADDFSVARQFLGGGADTTWRPLAQVRVYADTEVPDLTRSEDGGITVTTQLSAVVDASGHYEEATAGHAAETAFTLARDDDGEWRIISLDDGILLSAESFSVQYVAAPLYFPSSDGETLVADLRHYPRQNLASALVQGILAGPSAWLEPAVLTPAPVSTRLLLSSVSVSDGVATVDLTSDVLAATQRDRELLVAQLDRTLEVVAGVQDVVVTVGGAPLTVGDVQQLPTYPYTAAPLLAVAEGEPVVVDGGIGIRVPGASAPRTGVASDPAAMPSDPNEPIVYLDGPTRLMAAASAGRAARLIVSGSDLIAPSVDRFGWAWTAERTSSGTLRAALPRGGATEIDAPWLDGSNLREVRVSREGSRVAVIRESGGSVLVEVAGVQRGPDDTPRALGNSQVRVAVRLVDAVDLAWVDATTLAVLGRGQADTGLRVYLVTIGGATEALPSLPGAVALTAGRGASSVVVQTETDGLYEQTGASWSGIASGLRDPAYPG